MRVAANLSRSQYGERQGADYSLISATSAHARRLIVALIVDSKKSRNLALPQGIDGTQPAVQFPQSWGDLESTESLMVVSILIAPHRIESHIYSPSGHASPKDWICQRTTWQTGWLETLKAKRGLRSLRWDQGSSSYRTVS